MTIQALAEVCRFKTVGTVSEKYKMNEYLGFYIAQLFIHMTKESQQQVGRFMVYTVSSYGKGGPDGQGQPKPGDFLGLFCQNLDEISTDGD